MLSGLTRVRAVLAGRCALLRDARSRSATRSSGCSRSCAGLRRLRPGVHGEAVDPQPDEFMGEVATWDHAEAQLKRGARRRPASPTPERRRTARSTGRRSTSTSPTRIGRKWQCATIQLDYMQPERFDLKYIGADNAEHRPVVIHRAIFGSFERFIAHPDRALRRRVSAVAGAGAGARRRRLGEAGSLRARCGRRAARRAGCASSSTCRTTSSAPRSGARSWRRFPTCSSSATRKSPPVPSRRGSRDGKQLEPMTVDALADRLSQEARLPL